MTPNKAHIHSPTKNFERKRREQCALLPLFHQSKSRGNGTAATKKVKATHSQRVINQDDQEDQNKNQERRLRNLEKQHWYLAGLLLPSWLLSQWSAQKKASPTEGEILFNALISESKVYTCLCGREGRDQASYVVSRLGRSMYVQYARSASSAFLFSTRGWMRIEFGPAPLSLPPGPLSRFWGPFRPWFLTFLLR